MGWEREYEHWRDMGHTWGPGVDDVEEYTEEELAEIERSHQAYLQKLESYRVPAREEYLNAGKALKHALPDHKSIIHGTAPFHWREQYSNARLALCKEAAESLGYRFDLADNAMKGERLFAVTVNHYGWLPDRGGNLHRYAAFGIRDLEDCLQLTADFAAIGMQVTTFFDKSFHYTCNDTGELRNELEHWCASRGITLPNRAEPGLYKPSFKNQLLSASSAADAIHAQSSQKFFRQENKPERER